MKIRKAVITAAGPDQRHLPLQSVTGHSGTSRTALQVLLDEVFEAGIDQAAIIVAAGDSEVYRKAAGSHGDQVTFIEQAEPAGYGNAICQAVDFIDGEAFLLMVSDHLYLSHTESSCVSQLLKAAESNSCSVSAVQATHESKLPLYGVVGGRKVPQASGLYEVTNVIEKPSPTLAEQHLTVPGLRAAQYLCFFGMHVLSARFMDLLTASDSQKVSETLRELAEAERYLAFEIGGQRFNLDEDNGLLIAQLALALNSPQRDNVLKSLIELLATSNR
ncbi:MAG: sugar phosphate nucleotidyltransferase [Akkermansiaceae bacterium]|nr:sugar phosphate nucleotidyltransferase [Akkermansiaceae bacterium]MDP4779829.1 sugar phosphate nucleotidyltransferase [Akkermansiaceae bacterium]MDP4898743.1 sugar phosphate nucleotidyltransferase [Akkermansiaceae bacterium]